LPTVLTVLNNVLYVGEMEEISGAGTARVFALQASDGKIIWHDDIANIDITEVQVLVADDRVYVQNGNMVSALRVDNGAVLWQQRFGESEPFRLAASNGIVYVGGIGGGSTICAIQASKGTQLWCHIADNEAIILVQIS
jgi:outer membrane protein assembly factor BamB